MRFVVIDGLDAAGKDTHARMIKEKYESRGERVILRSHPSSDNIFGYRARQALLCRGKMSRLEASAFYAMDVIRSVKKYHGKADTVIFVRYLCGTAYLPYPMAKGFYRLFSKLLPTTDYMFFLDVEPDIAIERINGRDDTQMFENIDSLEKVRNRALRIANDWHIIDTSRPIDKVQGDIHNILEKLDNGHKR